MRLFLENDQFLQNVFVANSWNHAAIGVWYSPRQCFCQRYEAKLIDDPGPPESGRRDCPLINREITETDFLQSLDLRF
jgi:hypothetical protein